MVRPASALRRFLVLGGLAWACSGGEPRSGLPDAGSRTFAQFHVSVTASRQGEVVVGTRGRFLRYRGVDADSAAVLAGAIATPADELEPARCRLIDDEARLDEALGRAAENAAVQLLDAGDLVVRAGGRTIPVAPRYVAEVLPFVSGVSYEAESVPLDLGFEIDPALDVYLSAFGGDDMGRFDAVAALPEPPRFLSIGEVDLATGILREPLWLDASGDVELRWTADETRTDTVTILTIAWGEGGVRCRPDEAGRFRIGREALEWIPKGTIAPLAVERWQRTPLAIRGIDAGEIDVSTRDVVVIHVL